MTKYAGIDVSLEASRICIVDEADQVVWEGRAASDPEALGRALARHRDALERVGIEAGPLSEWLHDGLTAQGFEVVLLETRCLKGALSMLPVKSDRSDARGIAKAVRTGWYRPVHVKSLGARRVRALLRARRLILDKRADVAGCVRGLLRAEGIKLGLVSPARLAARVRDILDGHALALVIEPLLVAYEALRSQELAYDRSGRAPRRAPIRCAGCSPPHRGQAPSSPSPSGPSSMIRIASGAAARWAPSSA
jgi:transposase